ncbi:MAG: FkbM family methyltransferase [Aggregatilineales bacterium]
MAADQTSNNFSLLDSSLNLYRRTLKRFRPAHRAVHQIMTHGLIPILERNAHFQTMPDDPFWFRVELLTGRHEPGTTTQIKRLSQPGMTMLDIGAHVGYYTRMCAKIAGDTGQIVAFEPHPRNHKMLRGNLSGQNNVIFQQLAVAAGEGSAELHDYLMMSASGSLHYDESLRDVQKASLTGIAPRNTDEFQSQTFTVRTRAVDDVLTESNINEVHLIKMDIEGAEMGALRGMKQIIQQSPRLNLIMEYNPMGLQAFDNDPLDSLREVLAMGFTSMQVIDDKDGSLTDYTDNFDAIHTITETLKENMGVVNLLFSRDAG